MIATHDPATNLTAPCRLCGGPSTAAFEVGDRNRGLGAEVFAYCTCTSCGVIFQPEVPADLGRYYEQGGYGSVRDPEVMRFVRGEEIKLGLVRRHVPGGRMVEIGPGPGRFTRVAQRAGFEVTAIEMDPEYCRDLHDVLGVSAIHSNDPADALAELPPSSAVVMWHVIEHLPDPWEVVRRCVENLEPGGVLAISTPNPDSFQYRMLGRYWAHVDAPRHLQLIPSATLDRRLGELGMRAVLTTTTDQVGRDCNRLGWEYAIRRHPARRPSTGASMAASWWIALAFSAIERRGLAGAAYTSVFLRGDGPLGS